MYVKNRRISNKYKANGSHKTLYLTEFWCVDISYISYIKRWASFPTLARPKSMTKDINYDTGLLISKANDEITKH